MPRVSWGTLALVAAAAWAWSSARAEIKEKEGSEDFRKSVFDVRGDFGTARTRGTGISYHGGPVMLGTTNAYYIWYGNWSGNNAPAVTLLESLGGSIGGSPYFNINTTYYNGAGTHVANSVAFAGHATDN